MKSTFISVFLFLAISFAGFTQSFYQYFDGADTLAWNSIFMQLDTSASNVWQIGSPQKTIFSSAATLPNAIVTDTMHFYPVNANSSFQFGIDPLWFGFGILAIQWVQKLDFDPASDGGMIEYSTDTDPEWHNVFNNPYVYNFYGYDTLNVDTISNGQVAFTGTDTNWKNVWLCFDVSWLSIGDTLMFRYTLISDDADNSKEGWMMDNFMVHTTIFHTVNEKDQQEYLLVSPNPTTGDVHITARKTDGFHIIEKMELSDMSGKVVERFGTSPTKFTINIGNHPDGIYLLKIQTNLKTETFKISLKR
ncbi:MAG TPA: T9SS type A sorting domain-containing protein [Bacteroidales bacterium]|nr:T9SS type A sorting domain-containing protein [Bacteroidales bacterium]HPE57419.1 T9SS type A sorting domain-containing protein [Bacteroidales bacterium]